MNKKTLFSMAALFAIGVSGGAQEYATDHSGIMASTVYNAAELLTGKVPGLYIGSSEDNIFSIIDVNVRGINSYRTDNQPLWIVDGVELSADTGRNLNAFWQYDGPQPLQTIHPLSFLSPQDIESIQVLKDASATALYGTRGACGVIIIKTKKAASQAFQAHIQSNMGVNFGNNAFSVGHNHHLTVSGSGGKTSFQISGNYRDLSGGLSGNRGTLAGGVAGFDTAAGEHMHFGLKAIFNGGLLGSPLKGLTDYEDTHTEYRGLLSTYLIFAFRNIYVKLDAGADYYRADRGIWYGKGTDFGACTTLYPDGGAASLLTTNTLSYNAQLLLGYHTFFASDHRFEVNLAAKIYGDANTFNIQNGRNFVNHELKAKGLNYKSTLPANRNTDYAIFHPSARASISYGWKEYLGVHALIEADATPRYIFKNTVAIHPAVEAYVNFAQFLYADNKVISNISIRGGWGRSGRQVFSPYEWFGEVAATGIPIPESGTELFFEGLESLETQEWHVDGHLGFLQDRINLTLTYYDRKTADLFTVYNRGGDPVDNKGTIYLKYVKPVAVFEQMDPVINKGYEASLDLELIRSKTVQWSLSVNGAYNDNNYPLGRIIGYDVDSGGNLLDKTGEGRITEEDKVILGRTVPLFTGGLSTKLKVMNITFLAALSAASGHIVLNPALPVGSEKTTAHLGRGDFIRVNSLGINYSIPLKVKWLKGADIRLAARNPLILAYTDIPNYPSVILGASLTF